MTDAAKLSAKLEGDVVTILHRHPKKMLPEIGLPHEVCAPLTRQNRLNLPAIHQIARPEFIFAASVIAELHKPGRCINISNIDSRSVTALPLVHCQKGDLMLFVTARQIEFRDY